MFYFPLFRRGLNKTKSGRQRRPELELLEDRLVPSLPADGTILLCNFHDPNLDKNTDPISQITGIIGVDQSSGTQSQVAVNANLGSGSTSFDVPTDLVEASSTLLYVTDEGANEVLKITLSATSLPKVTVLANGGDLYEPNALTIVGGNLYVATMDGYDNNTYETAKLVEINTTNGNQTLISQGDFGMPTSETADSLTDTSTARCAKMIKLF